MWSGFTTNINPLLVPTMRLGIIIEVERELNMRVVMVSVELTTCLIPRQKSAIKPLQIAQNLLK